MRPIACPTCHAQLTFDTAPGGPEVYGEPQLRMVGATMGCGVCIEVFQLVAALCVQGMFDALKARIFSPIDPATLAAPMPDDAEVRDFLNRKSTEVA